ncbi:MAG: GlsB/YeaQ/YmgE family stress response membrane protein [Nocardiopsaceae bacterium]|nr:GlsB/YeaQ/YmgE family stress response membrane protein [Nocardiopsaceae bacterium]
MLSILWLLIIGLIIGAIGRFVIPGRNPMPWWLTMVLGVVGALVGGLIFSGFLKYVLAVVIAAILVVIVGNLQGRRRSRA